MFQTFSAHSVFVTRSRLVKFGHLSYRGLIGCAYWPEALGAVLKPVYSDATQLNSTSS